MEENSPEVDKFKKLLGKHNYEYVREKMQQHQDIYYDQLFQFHMLYNVQLKLAELGIKEPQIFKSYQIPSSSKFSTYIRNKEKRQKNVKPSQSPSSSQVSTYSMNKQKQQLPPVPTFSQGYNPRDSYLQTGPSLQSYFGGPAEGIFRPSESPSGSRDFTYYMTQEQLADYYNKNMNYIHPAQSTSVYNYSVDNPRNYLNTSSSRVMRPPKSLDFERPAEEDFVASRISSSTASYANDMNGKGKLPSLPIDNFGRPEVGVFRPSESPSGSQYLSYSMNREQLADDYNRNRKHFPPAQSTSRYSFENPIDYLNTSSSGVAMRPPISRNFRGPSQYSSSSENCAYHMNQQLDGSDMNNMNQSPVLPTYENIDHFQNPNFDPGSSSSGGAMRAPLGFDIASSSGVATSPPMGDGFKRPADRDLESGVAEDKPGSSSHVNPESNKRSSDGYDEASELDLTLSLPIGDGKGKKNSETLQPLPSQQSNLFDRTIDLTSRPHKSAFRSYGDMKATEESSSSGTNHEETMKTLWLFQD